MNSVQLTGRITKDAEIRKTANGVSYCGFTLAVKKPYNHELTDFVYCQAWRQSADYLGAYARRGDLIEVSGRLSVQQSQDENGQFSSRWSVNAEQVSILSSKRETSATEPESRQSGRDNASQPAQNATKPVKQAKTRQYQSPAQSAGMIDYSGLSVDDGLGLYGDNGAVSLDELSSDDLPF